ncbi:MAG TPA: hypothetical protein VKM55_30480 [Candidatus Lokiarchaeia archaeon]|nr:hypothetical protein [Candidatus Lokiarchaeia archaeon]
MPIFQHPYHYNNWDANVLFTEFMIQGIVAVITLILAIQLRRKQQIRKSNVLSALARAVGFMDAAIVAGTFPMIVSYYFGDVPILNGIPVGAGYYFWWSNFSYCLIVMGNLFIFKFIQYIFEKPSKTVFYMFLIINLVFVGWNVYYGIFVVVPGVSSLSIPMGALFLGIELYLWLLMLVLLTKTYRHMTPSIDRLGFFVMILATITTIVSNVLYAIGDIFDLKIVMPFYWAFFALTGILIYLGYLLPPWFKKFLERFNDAPLKNQKLSMQESVNVDTDSGK